MGTTLIFVGLRVSDGSENQYALIGLGVLRTGSRK
jgi:hypothetical protein